MDSDDDSPEERGVRLQTLLKGAKNGQTVSLSSGITFIKKLEIRRDVILVGGEDS
jgi:hypothetical protein